MRVESPEVPVSSVTAGVAIDFIVYGAHISLFALSTASFYRRIMGKGRKLPSIAMFMVTFLSFSTATLYIAARIFLLHALFRPAFTSGDDRRVLGGFLNQADDRTVLPNIIVTWAFVTQPIINDSVVIWRAWALFPRRHWVMAVPILFLLCTIGTSISFFSRTATPSGFASLLEATEITYLYAASLSFSLGTNAIATFLIGYKLWAYRKVAQHFVFRAGTTPPLQRILVLLVESGIIHCIFQLGFLITSYIVYPEVNLRWFFLIFQSFIGATSQIYPVLVVCLVHYHHAALDMYRAQGPQSQLSTAVHD